MLSIRLSGFSAKAFLMFCCTVLFFLLIFAVTYKYKYQLDLAYPDVVTDEFGNNGFWTLIYNQV